MTKQAVLHLNRGIPQGSQKNRYTFRIDREIHWATNKPTNRVLVARKSGDTYIVTVGLFERLEYLGRIKIEQYKGHWPVLKMLWTRFKEVVCK